MSLFMDLARGRPQDLDAILARGKRPPFELLAGYEFDGANVGFFPDLPFVVTWLGLGVKKFRKGFYQGGADRNPGGPAPFIQGYNVLIRQDGIDQPWTSLPSPEAPKRFGFYRVHAPIAGARDAKYPDAWLLDYGRGANAGTPRFLRDYLAQADPADPDVFVGKAYVALGPIRFLGGHFVLRRAEATTFRG